ncbi:MAG: FAD-binding oxidoreductase [Actinobacteria bacterium]|nr:FAD-binding oxidoreductase [Actinomycetota bacterium]
MMYMSKELLADINVLRGRLWGDVITPHDNDWDEVRKSFNLLIDQHPTAIVYAESPEDVQATIRFAKRAGLRVAPQGTTHNSGPLGPLRDTILLRTTRMKGVTIDTERRVARAQAGAVWGDVTPLLEGTGLAALHGSSPTVGIVGYSLGGGLGWQARKHGMQANSVTAVEIVDPHGELLRATADQNADLFWALRGGGGNFGVVTAIEFKLHRTPVVYAGAMFWPVEHAAKVFERWSEMLPQLPDEFTSTARVLAFPPLDEVPEFLRGRKMTVVNGAVLGDSELGERLLAPLRELEPEIDTFEEVDPSALARLHMDPEDPMPYLTGHMLLDELPADGLTGLIEAATAEDSPLVVFELRHMGGALHRAAPHHGARATMAGDLLLFLVGGVMEPGDEVAVNEAIEGVLEAAAPWRSATSYINFIEEPAAADEFFDPRTLDRLRQVKSEYDPQNLIKANHELV